MFTQPPAAELLEFKVEKHWVTVGAVCVVIDVKSEK